jgi:hypothetical protein
MIFRQPVGFFKMNQKGGIEEVKGDRTVKHYIHGYE